MIEYRAARPEDLERLLALCLAYAAERARLSGQRLAADHAGQVRANMESVLGHPAAFTVVAEEDGRFVGYAVATLQEPPPLFEGEPFVFVGDVYVEPSRRGQGIGTALVERLRGWAFLRGVGRLSAVLPARSEAARRLGARLGFSVVEELVYWQDSTGEGTGGTAEG